MLVKIEEILPGGLALNEPLPQPMLESVLSQAGDGESFHARSAATFHAQLNRVSGGVLLKGKVDCHITAPCKRCLKEAALTVPVSFILNLVPAQEFDVGASGEGEDDGGADSTGSFDLQDSDREPFDGKTIDLDQIVREQVLLALPLTVVCQDDCRGLCTVCGQNLNEKECGCERKMVDPRLMALKDIKL